MDLFTHVLVAYLLTYGLVGFHPQYLGAGALAGGLPDADALFFPLARRFPILRHHGITHSLLGVSVVAVVGGVVGPHLAPGSPLLYFAVMEAGGLAHVAQDAFTNFAVPPLLPFRSDLLHLDADRAVNFATLAVSVVSFYVLLGVERNHVAFAVYLGTLDVLAAFFAAYFALRLATRYFLGRRLRTYGDFDHVVPTGNPFVWLLIAERVAAGRERTTQARYVVGRGIVDGPRSVEGRIDGPMPAGPPASEGEALDWSLALARGSSRMLESTYHFGEAFRDPAGGWTAVWYSLEFTMLGRAAAVRVRFPADGRAPEVKSTFYRPTTRLA